MRWWKRTLSPARLPEAMTIGATDSTDTKASFSNYGNCIDWFAPGVSITSASFADDFSFTLKSGTSMAAPFTTGAAALYEQNHPAESPQHVRDALFSFTTKNIVTSALSANRHLLVNFEQVMTGPQLQPPVVAVTSPLNGGTVTKNANATIQAAASDSDGVVASVAFYINGQLAGTDTVAPYTWTFKTAPQRGVAYTIYAVATDNDGLMTASSAISVTTK